MMYGVGSTDAVTFVAVAVTALLATLLASALPAWQAARRSPATVLFDG
jgi:ABC-type lipoprotein release transport system permease subunit